MFGARMSKQMSARSLKIMQGIFMMAIAPIPLITDKFIKNSKKANVNSPLDNMLYLKLLGTTLAIGGFSGFQAG